MKLAVAPSSASFFLSFLWEMFRKAKEIGLGKNIYYAEAMATEIFFLRGDKRLVQPYKENSSTVSINLLEIVWYMLIIGVAKQ